MGRPRELYLEIPHQAAITEDNATISIDFIVFYRVVDARMSVVEVGNFAGAAQNIAATTLRSVVGDMSLDDVLAKREAMNEILRVKLDEVTERWGVKVTNVEIREIIPPPQVQDAMTRQMSAERTRAALVMSEAEEPSRPRSPSRRAAAVGDPERRGDRQAAILRAEGFALALTKIFESAQGVDAKTMSLQYLEALKQIGQSPSTKFVIPMEFTNLLSGITDFAEQAFDGGRADAATRHAEPAASARCRADDRPSGGPSTGGRRARPRLARDGDVHACGSSWSGTRVAFRMADHAALPMPRTPHRRRS